MRKVCLTLFLAVIVVVFLAGCTPAPVEPEPQQPPGDETPVAGENHLPGREVEDVPAGPEEKTDVIGLEGDNYTFRFSRLHAPGLGFVTYIPDDLTADQASSGEGDAVVIYANFVETKLTDAYMSIYLFPAGVSLEQARNQTREQLIANGFAVEDTLDPIEYPEEWALERFTFHKTAGNITYVGNVRFGNLGSRVLQVKTHMPEEYAEGFYPRAEKVLQDMEWYMK